MVDIKGINKAELLAALYNNSKPLGLGILHYTPENMTKEEAEEILKEDTYIDYLKGRVMKVDLSKDQFDTYLYNRDNGEGAAERIVEQLKETKNV